MLGQRRRRWANIEPALCQCPFTGNSVLRNFSLWSDAKTPEYPLESIQTRPVSENVNINLTHQPVKSRCCTDGISGSFKLSRPYPSGLYLCGQGGWWLQYSLGAPQQQPRWASTGGVCDTGRVRAGCLNPFSRTLQAPPPPPPHATCWQ